MSCPQTHSESPRTKTRPRSTPTGSNTTRPKLASASLAVTPKAKARTTMQVSTERSACSTIFPSTNPPLPSPVTPFGEPLTVAWSVEFTSSIRSTDVLSMFARRRYFFWKTTVLSLRPRLTTTALSNSNKFPTAATACLPQVSTVSD